ncbi:MAG: 23S rRNA (pseudouridine(1915)-N(3))-methyltransferase RlmH [Candidatus Gastranaerophilales bacterium]|nr:23S rRNA (pseudouridine(1915)-N(3))-methyltransferase RlmH [Candidatus Gastranaerophilales bacterium]
MNISVICIGKIKETYLKQGIDEFKKRLTPFCSLKIIELPAYQIKTPEDEKKAKTVEAQKILENLSENSYNIAMEVKGNTLSSEGLAQKISELTVSGVNQITFIIGGATGLDNSVLEKAHYKLSFSKLTFTHQMIRLLLLEQIYRAFKILNNEPYHK